MKFVSPSGTKLGESKWTYQWWYRYGCLKNWGCKTPQISPLKNRVWNHYKPSILGYPFFGNTRSFLRFRNDALPIFQLFSLPLGRSNVRTFEGFLSWGRFWHLGLWKVRDDLFIYLSIWLFACLFDEGAIFCRCWKHFSMKLSWVFFKENILYLILISHSFKTASHSVFQTYLKNKRVVVKRDEVGHGLRTANQGADWILAQGADP